MKSIKRRVDFIDVIICIHNRTFDFAVLNVCHTCYDLGLRVRIKDHSYIE